MAYSQADICIIAYLASWRTIMDKLCICIPVWDICIVKITSLKRDMGIMWTFCICIIVKSIGTENEKSRLA